MEGIAMTELRALRLGLIMAESKRSLRRNVRHRLFLVKTLRLALWRSNRRGGYDLREDVTVLESNTIRLGLITAESERMLLLKRRYPHGRAKEVATPSGKHPRGRIEHSLIGPHRSRIGEVTTIEWKTSSWSNWRLSDLASSRLKQRVCRGRMKDIVVAKLKALCLGLIIAKLESSLWPNKRHLLQLNQRCHTPLPPRDVTPPGSPKGDP